MNYPGIEVVKRAWSINNKEWKRLLFDIQAMERAALAAWRERKK